MFKKKDPSGEGPSRWLHGPQSFLVAWPLPWWSESRALGSRVGPHYYGKPPSTRLLPSHRAALSSFLLPNSSHFTHPPLLFFAAFTIHGESPTRLHVQGQEESKVSTTWSLPSRNLNYLGEMRPEHRQEPEDTVRSVERLVKRHFTKIMIVSGGLKRIEKTQESAVQGRQSHP